MRKHPDAQDVHFNIMMEQKMTPMEWIAGCSVFAAAIVGGFTSSQIVNRNIPERTLANQTQNENAAKGICFTLGGKKFEWSWANVPFAAMNCSR